MKFSRSKAVAREKKNHNGSTTGRKRNDMQSPLSGQTYMYTFHQKTQIAGSECRLKTGTAALEQVGGQCQGQLSRVEANGRFSTQGFSKIWRAKSANRWQHGRWMAALCTFSLQLSSTSVLIRLSHPSVNHAGSLHNYSRERKLFH